MCSFCLGLFEATTINVLMSMLGNVSSLDEILFCIEAIATRSVRVTELYMKRRWMETRFTPKTRLA